MKVKKIDLKQAKREFQRKLDLILKGEKTASAIAKEENLSRPEARRLYLASVRASIKQKPKYNNHEVNYAGYKFASKLEAGGFKYLKIREAAGEIKDIKCQDVVLLSAAGIKYICDFSYTDCKTGEREWLEIKGFETDTWLIKKKLWKTFGPGKLTIKFEKGKEEIIIPNDQHIACRLCGR